MLATELMNSAVTYKTPRGTRRTAVAPVTTRANIPPITITDVYESNMPLLSTAGAEKFANIWPEHANAGCYLIRGNTVARADITRHVQHVLTGVGYTTADIASFANVIMFTPFDTTFIAGSFRNVEVIELGHGMDLDLSVDFSWTSVPSATTAPQVASSPVLGEVVAADAAGELRRAARILINYVEIAFARRDLVAVNNLLHSFDPTSVSEWPTVGLLRSTARARKQLPAWERVLSEARHSFAARGLDVSGLLVGLPDQT